MRTRTHFEKETKVNSEMTYCQLFFVIVFFLLNQFQKEEHVSQLDQLRFLVIDEADRMVEQGHFQELSSILDLIHVAGYVQSEITATKCKIVGLGSVLGKLGKEKPIALN